MRRVYINEQCRIWFAKPGSPVLGGCRNRLRILEHLARSDHTIYLITNLSMLQESDPVHAAGLVSYLDEVASQYNETDKQRFIHIDIDEIVISEATVDFATQQYLLARAKTILSTGCSHPVVAADIVRTLSPAVSLNYYDFDSPFEVFTHKKLPDYFEISEAVAKKGCLFRCYYQGEYTFPNNDVLHFADPNHSVLVDYRKAIYKNLLCFGDAPRIHQDQVVHITGPEVYLFSVLNFICVERHDVYSVPKKYDFLACLVSSWGPDNIAPVKKVDDYMAVHCDRSWRDDGGRLREDDIQLLAAAITVQRRFRSIAKQQSF